MTAAASGAVARHATTHAVDSHGGGAATAMLASKIAVWPGAIVNARVPVASCVAPAGRAGSTGIGGSGDDEPVGLDDALGEGLRGGVAVADAVAAGVGEGRVVVGAALVVVGALVAAGALVLGVGEDPGMFRSVSVPQAEAIVASASTSPNGRLRG